MTVDMPMVVTVTVLFDHAMPMRMIATFIRFGICSMVVMIVPVAMTVFMVMVVVVIIWLIN
jgi:hypothetical protein